MVRWTKGLLVQPFDPDELRADSAVQVSSCSLYILLSTHGYVHCHCRGSRGAQGKAAYYYTGAELLMQHYSCKDPLAHTVLCKTKYFFLKAQYPMNTHTYPTRASLDLRSHH
jgi:hypothetical protein